MPNHNIRRLDGSSVMEPTNRQQFEGQSTVKFKITLLDTEQDYKVVIQEIDTGVEIVLKENIKSFEVASEMHRRYVHNIMCGHLYKVAGMFEGPRRGRSVLFELDVLPTWSYPNERN
jgi:hypothetical protein